MHVLFKKLRSIKLPYDKQGYIFFQCRNYRSLPIQQKCLIMNTCRSAAGKYADALLAFLTAGKSAVSVSLEYYISESSLYRFRKTFYEKYAEISGI